MNSFKRITIETVNDVAVIRINDPRLADALDVSEFEKELLSFIENDNPQRVLVDFAAVNHCSTTVINGLLRAKKRIVQGGGTLKLCEMRDAVRGAYRTLGLDDSVFEIHATQHEAMDSF